MPMLEATSAKELRDLSRKAAMCREKQGQAMTPEVSDVLGETAAELEIELLKSLVSQQLPRCPHCFEADEDDEHEAIGESDMGIVVLCTCGETYYAIGRPVTVWHTHKTPVTTT